MIFSQFTDIAEEDLIAVLRPAYEFYESEGKTEKRSAVLGVVFALADKIAERNEWSRDERNAFVNRLLGAE